MMLQFPNHFVFKKSIGAFLGKGEKASQREGRRKRIYSPFGAGDRKEGERV
jgi:hypothetical protein